MPTRFGWAHPRPRGCSARAELERVRSFFDNLAVNTTSRSGPLQKARKRGRQNSALLGALSSAEVPPVGQAFQPDKCVLRQRNVLHIRDRFRQARKPDLRALPFSYLTAHFRFQKRSFRKARCWSVRPPFAQRFTMRNAWTLAHPNIEPVFRATVFCGAENDSRS